MPMINSEILKQCLDNEQVALIIKEDFFITKALPLNQANDNAALIWIKPGSIDADSNVNNILAGLVVCDEAAYKLLSAKNERLINFVITQNPKHIFSLLANVFVKPKPLPGIHPTATVDPNAQLGSDVYIGPHTIIGECTIGDNTIIYGNCYLFSNVTVGKNVTINPGVVIGADGFGYSKNENGEIVKFPHIGGVVIMDNVDIGANTCIDRGALGNTIIHSNVKIDNLVHIAHNVVVQESAFIIANAMIGGSADVGANAWIAPSASIMQQLSIGSNATIGTGSVVTKNVPANEVWTGSPARHMADFLRMQKIIKNQLKDNNE
jgi:UDP-3-O-[3-hydroxymyristoyl] glucosamine N-acyltransferase